MSKPQQPKDLAYYLTLFTLEGHTTWRVHLGGHRQAFDAEQKNWVSQKRSAKVTMKHVIRIDRITGQIQPLP